MSRHGAEPSAAGWLAAPGQRRRLGLQPVEALRRRDRREHAARRVVGEVERVEDRLDARVVAVGVVVRRRPGRSRGTSRRAPACRADELEHRLGLDERLAAVAERGRGDALQPASCASPRSRSLSGRRGGRACAGRGSSGARRRRAGAARAGTARGPSWPAWTRRPARRGRRASRAGSRTSCWRAAAWSAAAAPSARASATFSAPIAARSRSCCRRGSARSSRCSASAVTSREESTMKRVRLSSSSVTSPTSRRDVDSSGLKYFAASPASRALALVLARRSP